MSGNWHPPENHRISISEAKELLAGDLGRAYREILSASCAPIYWWCANTKRILTNGTVTFVKTSTRIFGVTAAHVVNQFLSDKDTKSLRLQLMNAEIENLEIISISNRLDLVTISFSDSVLSDLGKALQPLTMRPELEPQEGRAIMFAGYPCESRDMRSELNVDFGLSTALGVARRVTEEQITYVVEWEYLIETEVQTAPLNYDLGGVSGGPMVAWFGTKSGLAHCNLCGVISQADNQLENVIAKRTHWIRADGTIGGPSDY